jgi:hypothetical protein
MPPWFVAWLSGFAFTQIVEVPIYAWCARDRGWVERIAIAFGASALTHPIVWFTIRDLFYGPHSMLDPSMAASDRWLAYAIVAESFAIGIEALYLRALSVRQPFVTALGANLMSVGLGLLSREVFGWP